MLGEYFCGCFLKKKKKKKCGAEKGGENVVQKKGGNPVRRLRAADAQRENS